MTEPERLLRQKARINMKNRFFSIKATDGTVKNFTIFANGDVSVQYFKIGEKVRTKYLGKYNN